MTSQTTALSSLPIAESDAATGVGTAEPASADAPSASALAAANAAAPAATAAPAASMLGVDLGGSDEVATTEQYVIFSLGGNAFGMSIDLVKEIIRYTQPTPMGSESSWVRGVINLRGGIIPVYDLAGRLGNATATVDVEESKIVIVDVAGRRSGVIVDDVEEVKSFERSQIEAIADDDYVSAIAKESERLVLLLDVDQLLAAL